MAVKITSQFPQSIFVYQHKGNRTCTSKFMFVCLLFRDFALMRNDLFVISEWAALCSAVVGIFTEDGLKTEPRIVEEVVLAWIIKRNLTQFCNHMTNLWSVSSFLILLTTPCCLGKPLSSGHSTKSWPETHLPRLQSWQRLCHGVWKENLHVNDLKLYMQHVQFCLIW